VGAGPLQNQAFDYDATIVERLRSWRGARGEAVDGRCAGRPLVPRTDQDALNPENGSSDLVGWDRIPPRPIRFSIGETGIHHFTVGRQRRHDFALPTVMSRHGNGLS
jgi:hypothetical protein